MWTHRNTYRVGRGGRSCPSLLGSPQTPWLRNSFLKHRTVLRGKAEGSCSKPTFKQVLKHPWLALSTFLLITWVRDAGSWAQGPGLHSCMSAVSTNSQSQQPRGSWIPEALLSDICFQRGFWLKVHQILTSGICPYLGKYFPLNVML